MRLHASCVAFGDKGVLLLGDSGSGKSDLALRLIHDGGQLVADDQVDVRKAAGGLYAEPPEVLRGMLEVRGIGVLRMEHCPLVQVALVIKLVAREAVERLPDEAFFDCLGLQVPLLSLHAFDSSTGAKIRLMLNAL